MSLDSNHNSSVIVTNEYEESNDTRNLKKQEMENKIAKNKRGHILETFLLKSFLQIFLLTYKRLPIQVTPIARVIAITLFLNSLKDLYDKMTKSKPKVNSPPVHEQNASSSSPPSSSPSSVHSSSPPVSSELRENEIEETAKTPLRSKL